MSTPDQRAADEDRDTAIETVQAAWAAGQIVEADRDKRIEQLQRAQTLGEVQMLVHDLRLPAAAPAAPPEEESLREPLPAPVETPPVAYGEPTYATLDQVTALAKGRRSRALFVIPLVVGIGVVVGIIGGIVALVAAIDDGVDGIAGLGEDKADVLSAQGYADMVAAIEDETGSTEAFSAVMYPTYAVVELPVDATTQREEYWYWDGHDLTRNDVKSTSSSDRVDLDTIEGSVIADLVDQVKYNVEAPTSWYAIVREPDDDRAVIFAYTSNEYSESAYLGARRDGTITYDSTKQ